jgi:hypothetical protein
VFFELQTNALLSIIATKHCHQRVWFRFKYQQNNALDNLLGYNHQETKAFKTSLLDKHISNYNHLGVIFFRPNTFVYAPARSGSRHVHACFRFTLYAPGSVSGLCHQRNPALVPGRSVAPATRLHESFMDGKVRMYL